MPLSEDQLKAMEASAPLLVAEVRRLRALVFEAANTIGTLETGANKAMEAAMYGAIDGGHHKMWVIDQMVRAIKGKDYEAWVATFEMGDDGPNTYEWDCGIPP